MAKGSRYTDEFKQEAVNQVIQHGYSVNDVAARLGISGKTLYNWVSKFSKPPTARKQDNDLQAEIARLKKQLKRAEQERDILKEGRKVLCQRVKERYAFIKSRSDRYPVRVLCRSLELHPSGYYAWLKVPHSHRQIEDQQLLTKIKQLWLESGGLHGYRNLHLDLQEEQIECGRDRVLRLMQSAKIQALRGYKRPKVDYSGHELISTPNVLNRQFEVSAPNQWWVSDITYIHTHEGFLFLAVVMDLYARNIVGWSMSERMTEDLVLSAITMAYWKRKPESIVHLHSDQGSQYSSRKCRKLLESFNIQQSMSRRGNCHDNAVAESFFSNLKKEKVRGRQYKTRAEARLDIFNYIEMFYNPKRRHTSNGRLSPTDYENHYFSSLKGV
ncbi:IS3 family transposase [Vibrio fluvialis]|nr:IS3 family transposase [Vibrio fluvialis]MBY7899281.1 IS3 family transposase [Vibrio fluvialis]